MNAAVFSKKQPGLACIGPGVKKRCIGWKLPSEISTVFWISWLNWSRASEALNARLVEPGIYPGAGRFAGAYA